MKKIPVFSRTFSISNSLVIPFFLIWTVFFAMPCFSAPGVSIKTDRDGITADKSFVLVLEVFWSGTADDYMIVPPAPVFPEKIETVSSSFFSSSAENSYSLIYRYTLKPAETGAYTISPIEVKYWARGEDRENTLMTEALSFTVEASPVFSLPIVLALAVLLVLAAGLFFVFFRNRQRPGRKESKNGTETAFQAEILQDFDRCKKCRTEGDAAGFYNAAIAVLSKTGEEKNVLEDLKRMCEKVTFGGYRPTAAETEPVVRRVAKAVAQTDPAKTDPTLELQKYCK